MTKLEAVNRILRAAREHPVSALGSSTENDTLMAEQILDEVLRREQMTGLHVNTAESSFTPDAATDRVELPVNTLQVKGWNQHADRNYFHREDAGATYLYDADESRFTFPDDETVYVRITQALDFAELPLHHQFSIADQAAVEYQMATLGSTTLHQYLQGLAARSRAIARAYDMRSRPRNQFQDGRSVGPRSGSMWVPRSWPFNDLRKQS
jgi:hypothetical protein